MIEKTYNLVFLCTGNSARSSMAEALVMLDRNAIQHEIKKIGDKPV